MKTTTQKPCAANRILAATIFGLIFGLPANAAIENIDQCRQAVDDFATKHEQQERFEGAKTLIIDAWNACKLNDYKAADAKMKAAEALITGGS
jgi:hypothetical protein